MGRLFWKFLLAFWGTVIAAGLIVGLGVALRGEPDGNGLRPASGPRAAFLVNSAAETLSDEGPEELRERLQERRRGRHGGSLLWVVDRNGEELLGRPLPPGSVTHARSLARLGAVAADEPAVRHVAVGGQEYLLFVAAPLPPGFRERHPLAPWLLIVAGACASLGFSGLLAWYFAKPVGHLRAAFAAAADGRLEVRVQPLIGRRRDEIADLGRHFDAMAARLQELIGAQRQLLHDVSHELRSPLARLQAAIGLARQDPARFESTLGRIEREASRLDELVGEVLTLSRLEAGVADAPIEAVDLGELIATIADDARFEAQAVSRDLHFEAPPGEIPAEVRAELLHRAFENVIRNAVRFTAPGTVVEVGVGVTTDSWLSLSVCDRGPGVPEADLQAIFEPFYRSASGTAVTGFGLGLAIARRAVESHGGTITARNREGGGLCVEIRLALRPIHQA
ncbi:MAG: HAMP domain-containing protein [Gammaproteobacteria bacterium]|nr:MAG: HAMP domain-containing protein [Gammaproteobacteria bacterium]